jgi:hypothetical protein
LFSEEKNQKTFPRFAREAGKSFLLLFFKKEGLPSPSLPAAPSCAA